MPSQKNINQVANLTEKLEKAKSLVLADFRGLTVQKQQELREKIKVAGGELTVTKNTLLQLAFKNQNYALPEELTGPIITLFSYGEEITPLKVLFDFAQENQIPKIKFGFLDHDFLSQERIEELAQLPSRDQLQTRLMGLLSTPLQATVYVLKANLNKLVMTLEAIKKKQS